jgi:hypothetical protein
LQDDFRAFRRQLDDKRPLIEQSILTGRQLVANEAPLSDASDSEGNSSFDSLLLFRPACGIYDLFFQVKREGEKR